MWRIRDAQWGRAATRQPSRLHALGVAGVARVTGAAGVVILCLGSDGVPPTSTSQSTTGPSTDSRASTPQATTGPSTDSQAFTPQIMGARITAVPVSGPVPSAGTGAHRASAGLDGPTFASVSLLAAASDAVVLGTVGRLVSSEVDDPDKDPRGPSGNRVNLHAFLIERSLHGNLVAGGSITVLNSARVNHHEGMSPLKVGQSLVLFLVHSPRGTPGIDSVGSFYAPRGQDQGVFDVREGRVATARSPIVQSLATRPLGAESDTQLLTTTVDELFDVPADGTPATRPAQPDGGP